MTWFETTLQREKETAVVRIDGHQVEVRLPGHKPARWTYKRLQEQAACVFEANVAALLATGYTEVSNTCDDTIPGALTFFPPEDPDEFYWLRWKSDSLEAALVDAADPQSTFDGTGAFLHGARRLALFDKSQLDPVWELVHALRRLAHHPVGQSVSAFEFAVAFSHDRLLDQIAQSPLANRLTHLTILSAWRHHAAQLRHRILAQQFPHLQALALERWSVPWFTGAPFHELQHLSLQRYDADVGAQAPPTPELSTTLDEVQANCPRLESLRLAEASVYPDCLEQLLAHPLVRRLKTLDLIATSYRPNLDLLLAQRDHLSNLEAIFITDHVLSEEDRARVAEWPAVCPVSYRFDTPRYQAWLASWLI